MSSGKTPACEGSIKLPRGSEERKAQKRDGHHGELRHPGYYLNRELTWLCFQHRVLYEAEDRRSRLLERLKFLAIVGSNLDEFHMKRIGGLKQQVGAELHVRTVDGRTPRQQIEESYEAVRRLTEHAHEVLGRLLKSLAKRGIRIVPYETLRAADRGWLREHYLENIFPLVTPQAIDPAHPFPFVSNLSLNLLVHAADPADDAIVVSRVKLPLGAGITRWIAVRGTHTYVALEDVMANNLDLLFPGFTIQSCDLFRVTRNAITEQDEEQADDLLEMIESELRERKFSSVVRLEVSQRMTQARRLQLASELGIEDPADVFEVDGLFALRDLMEIAQLPLPSLHDVAYRPIDHPQLPESRSVMQSVREAGSILLHHPYHSFSSSVERFLREAASDPHVRAIKMTLYRTSSETAVVDHLVEAARQGKQVTVVVELKARFDEEANIRWASRLESAGIHVTYGIVGLKTHAKTILVVRQGTSGLERFVHIGTGNYHAGTARLYTDFGLLSCDEDLGRDATELFNYLTTGANPTRRFQKLLVAPRQLKESLLHRIEREVDHAREGNKALIQMKMNALEDPDIVRALYRASQAGVQVDLLVRDSCRLRPGVPGLSDSIRVLSIVGRFLEHARVFYFYNDGEEEYWIGSADLMTRNLESRVEVLAPIESVELRRELRRILDIQLRDRRSAWEMEPDGAYEQRTPRRGGARQGSQEQLMYLTIERHEKLLRDKSSGEKKSRTRRVKPSERPPPPRRPTPRIEDLN